MTRHTMLLTAVFTAALAVSVSALPATIAPDTKVAWADNFQPEPVQSAQVHALVGASFHAIHAGF